MMGSQSDLPVMEEAARVLKEFGVVHETRIASAHRAPDLVDQLSRDAEGRGVQVIIAGAGGAAHLPGVVAARTLLPVIGVPLQGWAGYGEDALWSIVQMPPGIPVATVAIGGARNAALLALEILGLQDGEIRQRLAAYRREMARKAAETDAAISSAGMAPAKGDEL